MNKIQRLEYLKNLSLNIPVSIVLSPDNGIEEHHREFFKQYKRLNLRTFRDGSRRNNPLFTATNKDELINNILPEMLNQGYHCIVGEPVEPLSRIFSGTCWKRKNNDPIIVEIAYGQYTPRRVTNDGIVDERYETKKPNTKNEAVNRIIKLVNNIKDEHFILEFSLCKNPVGIKNENLVFWEINDDGLGSPRFDAKEELENE